MATKKINPALFIGLGGTGYKVLMQVKKAVLTNYGEIPSSIKFLCIDTDQKALKAAGEEIEYNKKNVDGTFSYVKENIEFLASEVLAIPLRNPQKLAREPYINKWLSPKVLPQIGPSDTGASQIRQKGRFAIFENISNIPKEIQNRINDLNSISQNRTMDYDIVPSLNGPCVHLVFSPCGGTGAGSFIDIVTLIKTLSPATVLYGYMVLPNFYKGFPYTTNIFPNAYASLMEIDHMMGMDVSTIQDSKIKFAHPDKIPYSNYFKGAFKVDYNGNNQYSELLQGTRFFEYLYLFDYTTEKGQNIEKVEDVYDRIGRILYLMISGPGTDMQSSYSNNDDYSVPSSNTFNNKRRNYSSMGVSQIILDRPFLKNLKINQMTKAILHNYCFENKNIDMDSVDTFIDSNNWREDKGCDQVIERLMKISQLKYDLTTLYPSKFEKGTWSADVNTNVNAFIKTWDEKCKTNCSNIKDEIVSDFKIKLSGKLDEFLKNKGGISQAKGFVSSLIGSFKGMADEMQNEFNAHKSNSEKYFKDSPEYVLTITSVSNDFFGAEKKAREATEVFLQHSEKIIKENFNKSRKESAKLFYDICIDFLSNYNSQLVNTENLLLEAYSDLHRENQKIINSNPNERDFERYIHTFYKDMLNENKDDIKFEEAYGNIDFATFLNFKKTSEIINKVQAYVSKSEALQSIDKLTVEGVLKALDPETLKKIVEYLDMSSAVCMKVDDSYAKTTFKPTMQQFGYILIEDEAKTLFKTDGELYNLLSAGGGYNSNTLKPFSTGDSDRITMVKIAGMFPASAINDIQTYKNKFTASPSFHYSDLYFEKYAQDLIDGPSDVEGEGAKWFTVGSALGKIFLERAALTFKKDSASREILLYEGSKNKTDRSEAVKIFVKNKENSAFIEKYFYTIWDNDRPKTIETLVSFYKKIETTEVLGKQFDNIEKDSPEYDNIFTEKTILKDFCISLGISAEKFD